MEPQTILPCSLCLKDCGNSPRGGRSHHLTLSSSLACCSLYMTLGFSCLEARRKGQCGGGLSPTQQPRLLHYQSRLHVCCCLNPKCLPSVTWRPVSDKARLLSQPLAFQWAPCRSTLLSLCFSVVVFLALRTAWGL